MTLQLFVRHYQIFRSTLPSNICSESTVRAELLRSICSCQLHVVQFHWSSCRFCLHECLISGLQFITNAWFFLEISFLSSPLFWVLCLQNYQCKGFRCSVLKYEPIHSSFVAVLTIFQPWIYVRCLWHRGSSAILTQFIERSVLDHIAYTTIMFSHFFFFFFFLGGREGGCENDCLKAFCGVT